MIEDNSSPNTFNFHDRPERTKHFFVYIMFNLGMVCNAMFDFFSLHKGLRHFKFQFSGAEKITFLVMANYDSSVVTEIVFALDITLL